MSRFFSHRLDKLVPYTPGEQPRDMQYIKLNTNESPYPPSPAVIEAATREAGRLQLYSDPTCRELTDKLAEAVSAELERQIPLLPRADIARESIDKNGKIIVAEGNLMLAIDIANEIAPEHLELSMDNPFDYLDKVKHAGSIFMGKYCPEALGDYFAGPNHTLPTSGTARFSSPLSVDDFVKKSQFTYYTRDALAKVSDKVAYFAEREGLSAHARSATVRFEGDAE